MLVFDQHRRDLCSPEARAKHNTLLGKVDPPPVKLLNEFGKGSFVFGCEHAGNRIPKALGTLGLTKIEQIRHIAWDVGAAQLTDKLSEKLDSPAVLQRYSRLVFDCNRTASHPGAFVVEADGAHVSGNAALSNADKHEREEAIYRPFHDALSGLTDRRRWSGERFAYVDILSNPEIRANLPKISDWPTFPQLFVDGELVGGCDIMTEMYQSGELKTLLAEVSPTEAGEEKEAE